MFDLIHFQWAIATASITIFVLWLLEPVAFKLNLLDLPHGRKDHAQATPSIGGLAMATGVLLTAFVTVEHVSAAFSGFAVGSVLLLGVGMLDDKYDLRWYWRILVQVVASLAMVYVGGVQIQHLGPVFGLGELSLGGFSVPFTVFATVGLINAINMVDGVDGLAGLLVGAALIMLLAGAIYSGNLAVAEMAVILLGSVVAFLSYNMRFPWQRQAKVFMGNAGSAFLGFAIAWMTFRLTQNPTYPVSPILALWFVPIPVMDTLVLMIRRGRNGQSPFVGDRNHIHHLMLEGGFGPTQAALALAVFSGACGLAAGEAMRVDIPTPFLLSSFLALCVAWYWLTGKRERAIGLFRTLRGRRIRPLHAHLKPVESSDRIVRARTSHSPQLAESAAFPGHAETAHLAPMTPDLRVRQG